MITTAHGYDFGIDTADWIDDADAARCADLIETYIQSWSAEKAAELHSLMTRARDDDGVDWDHPELVAVERQCSEIARGIMSGYAFAPGDGHNAGVYAA